MAEVIWTGPAFMDLRQIHEFIARDSVRYAAITIVKIRDAVARLGKFPQIRRAVPEFPETAYREVIVGNYRAIYRHDPVQRRVLILAVVPTSRMLPPVLEGRAGLS